MCLVARSCPIVWNPMDCSPLGSFVHGDCPGKNTGMDWERKTVLRNKDCLRMFVFVLKQLTKSLNPDIKIFCCNSLFFSDFAQKQQLSSCSSWLVFVVYSTYFKPLRLKQSIVALCLLSHPMKIWSQLFRDIIMLMF